MGLTDFFWFTSLISFFSRSTFSGIVVVVVVVVVLVVVAVVVVVVAVG